jgi:hypothetical protein
MRTQWFNDVDWSTSQLQLTSTPCVPVYILKITWWRQPMRTQHARQPLPGMNNIRHSHVDLHQYAIFSFTECSVNSFHTLYLLISFRNWICIHFYLLVLNFFLPDYPFTNSTIFYFIIYRNFEYPSYSPSHWPSHWLNSNCSTFLWSKK